MRLRLPILVSLIVAAALSWVLSPLFISAARAQAIVTNRVPAQVAEIWALYNNTIGIKSTAFTVPRTAGHGITGYQFANLAASTEYVHFYNTSTTPTVGTTPTTMTVAIPATTTLTFNTGNDVIIFSSGIAWSVNKSYSDTGTTAPASGDVIGFITYN
jgi:hypothetical protein